MIEAAFEGGVLDWCGYVRHMYNQLDLRTRFSGMYLL